MDQSLLLYRTQVQDEEARRRHRSKCRMRFAIEVAGLVPWRSALCFSGEEGLSRSLPWLEFEGDVIKVRGQQAPDPPPRQWQWAVVRWHLSNSALMS